jgi:hypothetical protein
MAGSPSKLGHHGEDGIACFDVGQKTTQKHTVNDDSQQQGLEFKVESENPP